MHGDRLWGVAEPCALTRGSGVQVSLCPHKEVMLTLWDGRGAASAPPSALPPQGGDNCLHSLFSCCIRGHLKCSQQTGKAKAEPASLCPPGGRPHEFLTLYPRQSKLPQTGKQTWNSENLANNQMRGLHLLFLVGGGGGEMGSRERSVCAEVDMVCSRHTSHQS